MGKLIFFKKGANLWLGLILILAFFLRFYRLASFPPLYSDEASFGYNAYAILKTGRDEYGQLLPVVLRSFGDYKPALSSYLAIPFIAFFGLNEFSVRFPSAFLGTLTVLLIYFLTKEIFKKQVISLKLSVISSLLLAISPWHIHLSRMTMLVSIETFFTTLGAYFFLRGIEGTRKRRRFLIISAASFALTFYAYYGARVTTSLLLLFVFLLYYKKLLGIKKEFFLAGAVFLLILTPMILALFKNPEIVTARVKWVSLFRYPEVRGKIWQAITSDGADFPPLLARFFHNKPLTYGKDILKRYLQHFSPDFLLFTGDKAAPFRIWGMGVFHFTLFPFLILGFLFFLKEMSKGQKVCLFWLLIAPLPASLTAYTPAANRAFEMVVPLQIITAVGLVNFFKSLKGKTLKRGVFLFVCFLILNFAYFFRQYFDLTIKKIPHDYIYGQKELIDFIKKKEKDYEKIVISKKASFYIFFLFYQQYSPTSFWQEAKINTTPDDFGFEHIEGFGKYSFRRDFDWAKEEKKPGVLYVALPSEISDRVLIGFKTVKQIFYPHGKKEIFPHGKIGIEAVEL